MHGGQAGCPCQNRRHRQLPACRCSTPHLTTNSTRPPQPRPPAHPPCPARRTDRWRAKYELLHVVRTHMGQDDAHYQCVYQREDSEGKPGVHLSKELMRIAGHALKANITTLGPLVLPISEQLLFFANLVARKVGGWVSGLVRAATGVGR